MYNPVFDSAVLNSKRLALLYWIASGCSGALLGKSGYSVSSNLPNQPVVNSISSFEPVSHISEERKCDKFPFW